MTTSSESVAHSSLGKSRVIGAAIIGNVLELYDFAIFGFYAATLSRIFFPTGDDVTSLLLTVGTFGAGFVMRPLGALVIGSYIDRAGRKAGLTLTILLMGLSTAMIAFCPSYAQIGIAAPAIIVAARLIQGFSLGGEVSGAIAYLVEQAPADKRGFYGSWQQTGQAFAGIMASFTGWALGTFLTPDALNAWGWRIPFVIGLLIVPVGFYLRAKLSETPEFASYLASGTQARSPISETFGAHWRHILGGLGAVIVGTAAVYVFFIYMPTYAIRELKIAPPVAFLANGLAYVVMLVLTPLTGAWSDRVGAKPLVMFSAISIGLSTLPLLAWLNMEPSLTRLILIQLVLAVFMSFFTGPMPTMLANLFPTRLRSTGVAIAYNISVAIFGGFAPFTAAWLVAKTGNPMAPGYYVVAAAIVSLIAMLTIRWKDVT